MSNDKVMVEMRQVSKRFGDIQALDAVSLNIERGRIIGLLGANGCGKSTLLRQIIGLYLPDEGECVTLGCEARNLSPKELGRIGYVHQEGELLDWMTVRQLVRYVAAYYPNWNGQLEEEFIRDFEMPVKVRVGTLSPGQRQRLAIMLAICFEPELLILDEPAAGLDPLARVQFLDLLLEMIQDESRTIVISSHILSDVEKVIDHVLIMKRGQIVRDCSFDALREEFCRVRLTSIAAELPAELPFAGVVECVRSEDAALLTLKQPDAEQLQETAKMLHCELEVKPLSLEDIYKIVVTGT